MPLHCELAVSPSTSSHPLATAAPNVFTPTTTFNPGRVVSLDVQVGRNNRKDWLGPNTATLTLLADNPDFLPGKPNWTQALRRRCRVYATIGSAEYTIFNGFVDDLEIDYPTFQADNACLLYTSPSPRD